MTSARIGKKIEPGFSLDVEFSVPPGVTALFGPAGAGKTLILEALAGFAAADSGRILLDDVLLFDAAARVQVPPHRRGCGYVAQRDALFPHMSLRQNLGFAAHRSPDVERPPPRGGGRGGGGGRRAGARPPRGGGDGGAVPVGGAGREPSARVGAAGEVARRGGARPAGLPEAATARRARLRRGPAPHGPGGVSGPRFAGISRQIVR